MPDSQTLARLLTRERQAILDGDFGELELIAPLKQSHLKTLAEANASSDDLRALFDAVSYNQTLLAAAIEGVKDVSNRIEALRASQEGFTAYGSAGQTSHIGPGRKGFERKA